jgi:SGNH domain (fused to AT3 domains)
VQAQGRPERIPTVVRSSCFGAAARDPANRCSERARQYEVVPTPNSARNRPNAPCTIVEEDGPLRVCEFGAPAASAAATVALLGDSHAAHWRAALEVVARAKRWRGLSIALSGCPFSTATRVLQEPLLSACIERNRKVPAWFARHPEIHTVFVSELSGATWLVPSGTDMFRDEVNDYIDAWNSLPASVQHIVVIRDDPKGLPSTQRCVERALARHRPAGLVCRVPRAAALDRDAAVVAAHRVGAPRLSVVDLTRYFCDARWCYPVIGGALVHKDEHHMTTVFVRTLGPYLLQAVDGLN